MQFINDVAPHMGLLKKLNLALPLLYNYDQAWAHLAALARVKENNSAQLYRPATDYRPHPSP